MLEVTDNLVEGIFIQESKNRFICTVMIGEEIEECYVPSASRLENYIKLKDKQVLLCPNISKKGRTRYSLFAVKFYSRYIILNLNMANDIVARYVENTWQYDKLYKEKVIAGYKSDFIVEDQGKIKIVEVKGIITTSKEVMFPSVFSKRAIDQLLIILELLKYGYEVTYFYVSLSPTVESIIINSEDEQYHKLLKKCISEGMEVVALKSYYKNNGVEISGDVSIFI